MYCRSEAGDLFHKLEVKEISRESVSRGFLIILAFKCGFKHFLNMNGAEKQECFHINISGRVRENSSNIDLVLYLIHIFTGLMFLCISCQQTNIKDCFLFVHISVLITSIFICIITIIVRPNLRHTPSISRMVCAELI